MRSGLETLQFDSRRTVEDVMDTHEGIRLLYVALTRARDHLVVSTHHTDRARARSHGGRIADCLADLGEDLGGLAERWTVAPAVDDADGGDLGVDEVVHGHEASPVPAPPSVDDVARWDETTASFARRRAATLAAAGGGVLSATAIAQLLAGRPTESGAVAPGPDGPGPLVGDAAVAEREPWRRGRAGTSIGSAVHAVLQHADLHDAASADLAALARWQTAVEGLPAATAETVEHKARAALVSPLLDRARAAQRIHRELHVAVPVTAIAEAGEHPIDLIEGFVDLAFEEDGGLVIVDFKTDDVPSGADVERALARYAPQGAAYALLLEAATGLRVTEVHFLFLRGDEAIDATVPDLRGAIEQVRATIATSAAGASPSPMGHDGMP